MAMTGADIAEFARRADSSIGPLEQELNAADAKLGDGDTGTMLARVVRRIVALEIEDTADVGAVCSAFARAAAAATGSSLGTLLATALLTVGRETKDVGDVPQSAYAGLAVAARDAMMARGGARIGDKTIVNSVDAIAAALAGMSPGDDAGAIVAEAAEEALETFRGRRNLVGRARMFADATVGKDDPGMLAVARLARAIVDGKVAAR